MPTNLKGKRKGRLGHEGPDLDAILNAEAQVVRHSQPVRTGHEGVGIDPLRKGLTSRAGLPDWPKSDPFILSANLAGWRLVPHPDRDGETVWLPHITQHPITPGFNGVNRYGDADGLLANIREVQGGRRVVLHPTKHAPPGCYSYCVPHELRRGGRTYLQPGSSIRIDMQNPKGELIADGKAEARWLMGLMEAGVLPSAPVASVAIAMRRKFQVGVERLEDQGANLPDHKNRKRVRTWMLRTAQLEAVNALLMTYEGA